MSEQAQRYSRRQIRNQVRAALAESNALVNKKSGRLVITPKTALKGYVKWTAAVKREVRALAQQFGLKVLGENLAELVYQLPRCTPLGRRA